MSENEEFNPDVESALDSNPSVYTENEPVLVYETSTTEEFEAHHLAAWLAEVDDLVATWGG